jgi:hypothetical protein
MDEDATAEELERPEFEGVHSVRQVLQLEGAAYRFAEDADFADRIFMLDARSKIAATRARLAPLSGWPSQEVKLARGSHEALNEADQAELAEGRRVLFEDLVGKLKRGELSARGELLMRIDGPSVGRAVPIPPRVWERCEVHWASSKIAVPGGTGLWIFDVVETEPRGRSAQQSSHGDPPAPRRASGGRPVLHAWDAFWGEIARYAASKDLGGTDASRVKLQQHLERWCAENMATDAEPGPTLRRSARSSSASTSASIGARVRPRRRCSMNRRLHSTMSSGSRSSAMRTWTGWRKSALRISGGEWKPGAPMRCAILPPRRPSSRRSSASSTSTDPCRNG